MDQEEINIEDGSGDKGFFTIIPNYILNHSTSNDQALYLQLKRLAGEKKDYCYPSYNYLIKNLGIGKKAIKKSFDYLIYHGWIENLGKRQIMTAGGQQWVNAYRIKDIWRLNMEHYKGGVERNPLNTKGGSKDTKGGLKDTKGGSEVAPKKNIRITTRTTRSAKPTARKDNKFSPEDYKQVISAYESCKGVKFQGNEYSPIQQDVKTMFLSGRKKEDIIRFMEWFREKSESGEKKYEWTTNWTIKTVKFKIAEFLSGKLGEVENDIEIPEYAKKWLK